jgi:NADPH:quinone reductase-like Zn-dependent oxidoreductase
VRAIAISEYGGADVLREVDLDDPLLGPDSVLIRVKAAGVNPVDAYVRAGYLQGAFPSAFPLIPGWDVAGVIEKVGPSIREFSAGDEVIGYVRKDHVQNGTYAELVAAPIRCVARRPTSVGWAEAAAIPLAGLTAYQSLLVAGVTAGETVLVHNASGGVGSFAVQIAARIKGARVIGTAGEGNADYVRSLGGEHVTYGEGLADRVRELAPDGVSAVLDFVGGEALEASPQLVGSPERIVSIVDSEKVLEIGGRYVFVRPDPQHLDELARWVDEGSLTVHVSERLPLADAAEAHRRIESNRTRGKIVLEL